MSVFAGFFLLFFPLSVTLDFYGDILQNKFCFAVRLFDFLLKSGYARAGRKGVTVCLKKHKEHFFPYQNYKDTEKMLSAFPSVQPRSFFQVIEIGSGENLFPAIGLCAFFNIAANEVFALYHRNRSFLRLRHNCVLVSDETRFRILFRLTLVSNLLSFLIAIAKNLGGILWQKIKK